jgi:hypothetical protein
VVGMWKGRGVSEDGVLMWLCWDGGYVNCYRAVRMIGSDSESETGTGSDSVLLYSGKPCRNP